MGHLIQIREGHSWLAANWAAEHVIRLILLFLPLSISPETRQALERVERESCDLNLSSCSQADFEAILTASEQAFAALMAAGPNSDYFHDPDFYPSFVERFQELIELFRSDERALNRNG